MTSRGDLYVSGLNTGKRLSFSTTTITKNNNQEIFREFTKVSENIIDIKIGPSHSVIWLSNGTILNVDNGKITQVKIPNCSSELNQIYTIDSSKSHTMYFELATTNRLNNSIYDDA